MTAGTTASTSDQVDSADQAPREAEPAEQQVEVVLPGAASKNTLLVWARRVLVVVVVAFAAYQVVQQWPQVSGTLSQLPWWRVALSFATVTAGVVLSPLVWRTMLADLGSTIPVRDASKIYLVGQLGKYVPGSVLAFLLQMELARAAGVTRARSFTASLLTAGIAVVASLLAGTLAISAFAANEPVLLWLFALLPIGLVLLHPIPLTWVVNRLMVLLRRAPLPRRLTGRAIARATGTSLAMYACYGLHLYVLAGSLQETRGTSTAVLLLLGIGGMGLAMTAGLVAFVLPSGIGARELVIVGALSTVMPYGAALALAVVSRAMFTVVELLTAGAVTLVVRLSRGRSAA